MTRAEYRKVRQSVKYVDWRKVEHIALTNEQFIDKIKECEEKLTRKRSTECSRTKKADWGYENDNIYDLYVSEKKRRVYKQIYLRENGEYKVYTTSRKDCDWAGNYMGSTAFRAVKDFFITRTGLGRYGMNKAFGASEYSLRDCIPSPIYYTNIMYVSRDKEHIKTFKASCIDGCSQYPTAMIEKLPTSEECQTVKGTVKPSKEFPFAFYLKSTHIAVYDEFDSHDWLKLPFIDFLFPNTKQGQKKKLLMCTTHIDDDVTLLMKASKYTFEDEMKHFFRIKETQPHFSKAYSEAKKVMNAFIGELHQYKEKSYASRPFAHLAAVGIARANNKLIQMMQKVNIKDIVHVCVDSIIYKGDKKLGVEERALGNFEQEFIDCDLAIKSSNNYIAMRDGKLVKFKHGGFNIYTDGRRIEENVPKKYEDMFDWTAYNINSDYDDIEEYKNGDI